MDRLRDRYLDAQYRASLATLAEPYPHISVAKATERFLEHCVTIDDASDESMDVATVRRIAYQRLSDEIDE